MIIIIVIMIYIIDVIDVIDRVIIATILIIIYKNNSNINNKTLHIVSMNVLYLKLFTFIWIFNSFNK